MPYSLSNYSIDGTWNQHCSIILDVLFDYMIKKHYSKHSNFPRSWRTKKVLDADKNFQKSVFSPSAIGSISIDPIDAFLNNGNEKLREREREIYDGREEWDKPPTFKDHLKSHFEYDYDYLVFLDTYKESSSFIHADLKLALPFEDLFENYEILSNYKYKFPGLLQKIADTKFKMDYKVKYIEQEPTFDDKEKALTKGVMIDSVYQMKEFESLFGVEINRDSFTLNLSSPLGKMVLHNMIILDTDWIEKEVLTLSKNAYFIYKKFILNRFAAKNKVNEIVLWYDQMKTFLDMNWKNDSGNYTVINKALDEIRHKGLIQDYNWNRNFAKQRQYRITRPH